MHTDRAVRRRPLRVAVLGEKLIAQECLEWLYERADTTVCLVGTSRHDWQANLPAWAAAHGIPALDTSVNAHLPLLASLELDLIFSIQYRWLIRQSVLDTARLGAFNLHLGLLPRYGGCYPITWAILNGEPDAGPTLHRMTERFDEGDVIAQARVAVTPTTTARELYERLAAAGLAIFRQTYPRLAQGQVSALPQRVEDRRYYGRNSIDFAQDRWVDWADDAEDVCRRIRAFTFPPFQVAVARLHTPDRAVTDIELLATECMTLEPGTGTGIPGTILRRTGDGAVVVEAGHGTAVRVTMLGGMDAGRWFEGQAYRPESCRFG